MNLPPTIDTTRHDTTRHDTSIVRIAVIGSTDGVVNIVNSIGSSGNYPVISAIAEHYPAKKFWHHFFRLSITGKIKLLVKTAKAYRPIRHSTKLLRKVPAVYFVSPDVTCRTFDLIPQKVFDEADIFLLACDDDNSEQSYAKNSDYAAALMKRGISKDNIYVVPPVMYRAELPVIVDGKLSPLCKKLTDTKPILRYMEYHVTDFCNLKCKGCGHMANHVKELEFSGADKFRFSLEKLSEKFANIETLRIMGGEPLLCRELHEYINAAHEVFPCSHIKIVTNALLYKNITDLTVQAVKNAGAEIQVTQYPPTREIAAEFIAFCQERGLKLHISRPVTQFFKRFVSGRDADYEHIWYTCESKYCHFLHGTTFYPCPGLWTHTDPKFIGIDGNNTFPESEAREYSYDLRQDINDDGWDILSKFEVPMKLCCECGDAKTLFTWESETGK